MAHPPRLFRAPREAFGVAARFDQDAIGAAVVRVDLGAHVDERRDGDVEHLAVPREPGVGQPPLSQMRIGARLETTRTGVPHHGPWWR